MLGGNNVWSVRELCEWSICGLYGLAVGLIYRIFRGLILGVFIEYSEV